MKNTLYTLLLSSSLVLANPTKVENNTSIIQNKVCTTLENKNEKIANIFFEYIKNTNSFKKIKWIDFGEKEDFQYNLMDCILYHNDFYNKNFIKNFLLGEKNEKGEIISEGYGFTKEEVDKILNKYQELLKKVKEK